MSEKIEKSVLPNITYISNVPPENGFIFSLNGLSRKPVF